LTQGATKSIGHVVRAPKTAELIAGHIRREIVRGDLREGDTLAPELTLMEQFGVSRPTLREAFRILETESLITVRRGARGGAQVTAPHLSVAARYVGLLLQVQGVTITDVYEARTELEPVCARLLAERRTEQDVADLRASVADLDDLVKNGGSPLPKPEAWAELSRRFHELIMERSGNRTMAVQGGVLDDIIATHFRITVARGAGNPDSLRTFRRTVRSYTKLVDLVEAKDGPGAEAHWREHMEVAGRILLRDGMNTTPVVDLFT